MTRTALLNLRLQLLGLWLAVLNYADYLILGWIETAKSARERLRGLSS